MARFGKLLGSAALVASVFAAQQVNALTFNLIDSSGSLAGTTAGKDFQIAANYWSSVLTNNVTVNLQVGYSPLASGVIGSTSSHKSDVSTAAVYQALHTTGNSLLDAAALSHLQPLDANGGISFITNSNAGGVISKTEKVYDHDDSSNNVMLDVNTSVLKALGFAGYDNTIDGSINFSSNFAFDFDPTDGIDAGKIDFVGVAIHEIGHALGFTSGVDTYDRYAQDTTSSTSGMAVDLNDQAVFSTLDLFRYSTDPKHLVPGTIPALDLSTGGSSYFSVDGSVFDGAYFSTGTYSGNGRQASHFKDTSGCGAQIGIMDPTFCRGQLGTVTADDLAVFDALGWNLNFNILADLDYARNTGQIYASDGVVVGNEPGVSLGTPEPASWVMMVAGFGLIGGTLRRRSMRFSTIA